MKKIGLGLLVIGFVWLLIDAGSSFTSYQHTKWIWKSQNLPAGDAVPRDVAVSAMRELSLDLNNRHRIVLLPGCVMLAGGLLILLARSPKRINQAGNTDSEPRP
jgi:hypothetical protein